MGGSDHRALMITTTPRPIPILHELEAQPSTVVVTGTSYENRSNLDPSWFAETIRAYEGTTRTGPAGGWAATPRDTEPADCGATETFNALHRRLA